MKYHGVPIDFGRWMLFATPLSIVYLAITWLLLTQWLFPVKLQNFAGGRELILAEYRKLGGVSRGEWSVLVVFACTAGLWMFRGLLLEWRWLVDLLPAIKSLDD